MGSRFETHPGSKNQPMQLVGELRKKQIGAVDEDKKTRNDLQLLSKELHTGMGIGIIHPEMGYDQFVNLNRATKERKRDRTTTLQCAFRPLGMKTFGGIEKETALRVLHQESVKSSTLYFEDLNCAIQNVLRGICAVDLKGSAKRVGVTCVLRFVFDIAIYGAISDWIRVISDPEQEVRVEQKTSFLYTRETKTKNWSPSQAEELSLRDGIIYVAYTLVPVTDDEYDEDALGKTIVHVEVSRDIVYGTDENGTPYEWVMPGDRRSDGYMMYRMSLGTTLVLCATAVVRFKSSMHNKYRVIGTAFRVTDRNPTVDIGHPKNEDAYEETTPSSLNVFTSDIVVKEISKEPVKEVSKDGLKTEANVGSIPYLGNVDTSVEGRGEILQKFTNEMQLRGTGCSLPEMLTMFPTRLIMTPFVLKNMELGPAVKNLADDVCMTLSSLNLRQLFSKSERKPNDNFFKFNLEEIPYVVDDPEDEIDNSEEESVEGEESESDESENESEKSRSLSSESDGSEGAQSEDGDWNASDTEMKEASQSVAPSVSDSGSDKESGSGEESRKTSGAKTVITRLPGSEAEKEKSKETIGSAPEDKSLDTGKNAGVEDKEPEGVEVPGAQSEGKGEKKDGEEEKDEAELKTQTPPKEVTEDKEPEGVEVPDAECEAEGEKKDGEEKKDEGKLETRTPPKEVTEDPEPEGVEVPDAESEGEGEKKDGEEKKDETELETQTPPKQAIRRSTRTRKQKDRRVWVTPAQIRKDRKEKEEKENEEKVKENEKEGKEAQKTKEEEKAKKSEKEGEEGQEKEKKESGKVEKIAPPPEPEDGEGGKKSENEKGEKEENEKVVSLGKRKRDE